MLKEKKREANTNLKIVLPGLISVALELSTASLKGISIPACSGSNLKHIDIHFSLNLYQSNCNTAPIYPAFTEDRERNVVISKIVQVLK